MTDYKIFKEFLPEKKIVVCFIFPSMNFFSFKEYEPMQLITMT